MGLRISTTGISGHANLLSPNCRFLLGTRGFRQFGVRLKSYPLKFSGVRIRKSKQPKIQWNKSTLVQLPLTTLGQETRWAYSTTPPSPHGAIARRTSGRVDRIQSERGISRGEGDKCRFSVASAARLGLQSSYTGCWTDPNIFACSQLRRRQVKSTRPRSSLSTRLYSTTI